MFRNLCCGAIGVGADLKQSLEYAKLGGYQGVDVPVGEVAEMLKTHGPCHVTDLFEAAGMQMGSIGFPASWMGSEEEWQASLEGCRQACEVAQAIGATRSATWMPSWSDEREWDENIEFHVTRFQPIAQIMADHGVRLGLEFLGPKTLRNGHKYEFIHTLGGMLELCAAVGTGNMGLLLDAWHWYTSGGTLEDLKQISNADVVYVHINDAPPGIALDEQMDSVRMVHGESGVIDLTGFLQGLHAAGYDGPVTPEPFSQKVREMAPEEAVSYTGKLLQEVWEKAGV